MRPIIARTLAATVADRLREAIMVGDHPPHAQLRQEALAEHYGVSRIPLREALLQLEAEGLVSIVPHKGAVVTAMTEAETNDVFDLRTLLEPRVLAASVPLLTPPDFALIEAAAAAFARAVEAGEFAKFGPLNSAFHMALYARAPLPRSLALVANLMQASDRYTRVQLSRADAFPRAVREHEALIALCRTGDVPAATAMLVEHIEAVRADLVALI